VFKFQNLEPHAHQVKICRNFKYTQKGQKSNKTLWPNYFSKRPNFHNSAAKGASSQPWLNVCGCWLDVCGCMAGANKISQISAGAGYGYGAGAVAGKNFQPSQDFRYIFHERITARGLIVLEASPLLYFMFSLPCYIFLLRSH